MGTAPVLARACRKVFVMLQAERLRNASIDRLSSQREIHITTSITRSEDYAMTTNTTTTSARVDATCWAKRAVCSCGYSCECPFGDRFHLEALLTCCPQCGANLRSMRVDTFGWVSDAVLWKPWTWGSGRWVPRCEHEPEEISLGSDHFTACKKCDCRIG